MERAGSQGDGCETCPPGYNCPEGAETYLLHPCPRGAYCPNDGTNTIVLCPAGTHTLYWNSISSNDCVPCEAGKFCPTGIDLPIDCPEHWVCPKAAAPVKCPAGTYGGGADLG